MNQQCALVTWKVKHILYQKQHGYHTQGADSAALHFPEPPICSYVYSAGLPAQERADRAGLEESHEKGQRAGAPLLQRNG